MSLVLWCGPLASFMCYTCGDVSKVLCFFIFEGFFLSGLVKFCSNCSLTNS